MLPLLKLIGSVSNKYSTPDRFLVLSYSLLITFIWCGKYTLVTTSKLTKVYKVLNAKMTKSQALSKFKELKEYLEMGLINKEEFDRESKKIKKLLLEN